MNGYRLIEAVRKVRGEVSDYKLSQLLNIDRAKISQWKKGRSNPDLMTGLRLAAEAGLSAKEALNLVTSPAPCAKCGKVHVMQEQCILC